MFNLTESFKRGYESFLEEQAEKDLEQGIENLEQAQKEAEDAFKVIKEYFTLYAAAEGTLSEATKVDGLEADKAKNIMSTISRLIGDDEVMSKAGYQPLAGYATVKTIGEMKFPNNILFFIQSLISWLTTLVKKVISFFTNGLQRLFGLKAGEEFKPDYNLSLEKAKTIETFTVPLVGPSTGMPKAARIVSVGLEHLEKIENILATKFREEFLQESNGDERDSSKEGTSDKEKVGISKREPIKALELNISKEMEELHQNLQHFLDLFDNAYGSNSEHLFDTDDLEMLLQLFKTTLKGVLDGTVPSYAISGQITELETLNKESLIENLKRTYVNTEKLKSAYVQTESSIQRTLQILSSKQIMAAQTMGIQFRFYSASTYVQMSKILEVITPRIKNAESLEKRLNRMREVFDKVTIELGKQRQPIMALGNVVYTSVAQKRINDLFDSAKVVSQTVTLRLTTLALYIRQMKNIFESIRNANAINSRAKDFLKKEVFADTGLAGGLFSSGLGTQYKTQKGLFGFFKK
jgi:hypothetical protein